MTKQRIAEKKMWRVADYLSTCGHAAKTLGMTALSADYASARIAVTNAAAAIQEDRYREEDRIRPYRRIYFRAAVSVAA